MYKRLIPTYFGIFQLAKSTVAGLYGIAIQHQVANIASKCFICHKTLTKCCIFHTNEVTVF